MPPSRRAVLAGMGGVAAFAAGGGVAAFAALPAQARDTGVYLGARWDETQKRGFAGAFDATGNRIFDLDLPDRGHGLARRRGASGGARPPARFLGCGD